MRARRGVWFRAVALILLAMITAGILSVGAGAAFGQPHESVADLDACGVPCWRGIVPHETRITDAQHILNDGGYAVAGIIYRYEFIIFNPQDRAQCSVRLGYNNRRVATLSLTECPELRLGDVMSVLGAPEARVAWNTISFRQSTVFVTVRADICRESVNAYTPVSSIYLATAQRSGRGLMLRQFAPSETGVYPWRGFLNRAHHFLEAPELAVCG